MKSGVLLPQSASFAPARPALFYNVFYFLRYKTGRPPKGLLVPRKAVTNLAFLRHHHGSSFVFFYFASRALVPK